MVTVYFTNYRHIYCDDNHGQESLDQAQGLCDRLRRKTHPPPLGSLCTEHGAKNIRLLKVFESLWVSPSLLSFSPGPSPLHVYNSLLSVGHIETQIMSSFSYQTFLLQNTKLKQKGGL